MVALEDVVTWNFYCDDADLKAVVTPLRYPIRQVSS